MHYPTAPETRSTDRGFSLIELLVVIIIIGILAAIAIPAFLSQRTRAAEAGEKADARALAIQLETYYVDAQRYPAGGELTWSAAARSVQFGTSGEIVRLSTNNVAQVMRSSGGQSFCVEIRNTFTDSTAVYESGGGGLRAVGAGAACRPEYDETVLAYPAP